MQRRHRRLATAVALASSLACSASYAALDNKGTEFILPFLPNYGGTATVIQLHLTAETATDVLVEYPVNAPTFTTTVGVTPGNITIVNIPLTADNWTSGAIANNAVRATADEEFVAYSVNLQPYTSDAALGLPVDVLNTNYIVASYPPLSGYGSQMAVYAAYDNTTVTITQSVTTAGRTAGVPYSMTLNRGQAYYIESSGSGTAHDLSGTIIEASRPVGLVNGVECVNIPNATAYCDHVYEIAQPTQTWGNSVLVANLPNRAGSLYRIYASQDDTMVTADGVLLGTLDRGQFLDTGVIPGDHQYVGDKPIYVVQYMPGSQYPGSGGIGDPAMGNMIPFAQYQNAYTFSTVGGAQFVQHYLTIIADSRDAGTLVLDGSPVPAADFTAIGSSGYSVARVRLNEGVHTTSSTHGHGITVEGYNRDDSYIYPGGALFQFIDPTGDPFAPQCSASANGANSFSGLVTDNTPSEDSNDNDVLDPGEDGNGNGVIDADTGVFIVESVTLNNATLTVAPFTPGDAQATFAVNRIDNSQTGSATIRGTDGGGNTCSVDVTFSIDEPEPVACDIDGDFDVDRNDVNVIRAARNTPAGVDDPRDADGDGTITLNDARICVTQCTRTQCAP